MKTAKKSVTKYIEQQVTKEYYQYTKIYPTHPAQKVQNYKMQPMLG